MSIMQLIWSKAFERNIFVQFVKTLELCNKALPYKISRAPGKRNSFSSWIEKQGSLGQHREHSKVLETGQNVSGGKTLIITYV